MDFPHDLKEEDLSFVDLIYLIEDYKECLNAGFGIDINLCKYVLKCHDDGIIKVPDDVLEEVIKNCYIGNAHYELKERGLR